MGYQLYWVRLCGVADDGGLATVAVGVRPNAHSPAVPVIPAAAAAMSVATSGTTPVHAVQRRVGPGRPVHALQVGAVAVEVGQAPVPGRSAGSCSSRIAFGVMGLV